MFQINTTKTFSGLVADVSRTGQGRVFNEAWMTLMKSARQNWILCQRWKSVSKKEMFSRVSQIS